MAFVAGIVVVAVAATLLRRTVWTSFEHRL
jgi:hypothetical protein